MFEIGWFWLGTMTRVLMCSENSEAYCSAGRGVMNSASLLWKSEYTDLDGCRTLELSHSAHERQSYSQVCRQWRQFA